MISQQKLFRFVWKCNQKWVFDKKKIYFSQQPGPFVKMCQLRKKNELTDILITVCCTIRWRRRQRLIQVTSLPRFIYQNCCILPPFFFTCYQPVSLLNILVHLFLILRDSLQNIFIPIFETIKFLLAFYNCLSVRLDN